MLVFDGGRKLVWRKTYRRRINFMNVSKKIISNLEKCYAIAPLTYNGRKCFLVAAEKRNPCYLFSEDGENEAGDVDEETFTVGIVFGAVDTGPCVRKFVKRLRGDSRAGIEVYGVLDKVEAVRERIFSIVKRSTHGAIFRSATRTESNLLDYPLEWAKLTAQYAEPEIL